MRRALRLAVRARGKTAPNPMVGAVVVRDGRIISEAFHRRAGEDHAERAAIKKAVDTARGATLYVSLEPCCHYGRTPPCTDVIIESGIARVVAAVQDPSPEVSGKGFKILRKAGIKVKTGILEEEARRINEAFFTYYEKNRPFVTLKWAMSLDGRTSTDSGNSKWITGKESRRYAHRLRSFHDAIAVGIGTLLTDDPRLTVRLPNHTGHQPHCIIIDTKLRTPLKAAILKAPHKVFIACAPINNHTLARRAERLEDAGANILPIPTDEGMVSIKGLLQEVYRAGLQSLLVEGGRYLAGSFVKAHLADKAVIFIAPRIMGGMGATSPLLFNGVRTVADAINLKDISVRRLDTDILIEGYFEEGKGKSKRNQNA